jgi:hypothetical protein
MEIVKKKTTLAYCDSTHLSTPRVPNTQNSRFADLCPKVKENKKLKINITVIRPRKYVLSQIQPHGVSRGIHWWQNILGVTSPSNSRHQRTSYAGTLFSDKQHNPYGRSPLQNPLRIKINL